MKNYVYLCVWNLLMLNHSGNILNDWNGVQNKILKYDQPLYYFDSQKLRLNPLTKNIMWNTVSSHPWVEERENPIC